MQQSGVARRAQFKLEVSHTGDFHEREADVAAQAMVQGAPASVSGASGMARSTIQRQQKSDGPERNSHDADEKAKIAEQRRLRNAVGEATTTLEQATKELGKILAERKKAPKKPSPEKEIAEIRKKAEAAKKSGQPSCQKLKEIAADEGKADPAVARFEKALKAWEAKARAAAAPGREATEGATSAGAEEAAGGWSTDAPQGPTAVPDITSNETTPPMSSTS